MRIFVSYRRADVGHAGRLTDALVQRLGVKNVFRDVTNIGVGRDFRTAIRQALDDCDAALAVIGPGWFAASTPEGRPRLFDPEDYVRLELASVLSRDLPVAPVLVGGAALPAAADLPEDLRPLVQRQAIVLRDETWHQDVENLLRSLRGGQAFAPRSSRRRVGMAVGTAVLAALIATAWWVGRPSGRSSNGSSTSAASGAAVSPSCPDPTGQGWTKLTLSEKATARQQFEDGTLVFSVRAASWRPLGQARWQVVIDTTAANHRTSNYFYHEGDRYEAIIVGRQFGLSCFESSPEALIPGAVGDARTGWVVSCEPSGRVDLLLYLGTRLPVSDAPEPSPC